MLSCNRTSFDPITDTPRDRNGEYKTPDKKPLPPLPLATCSTTNPYGPGRVAVRRRWIDPAPYGVMHKVKTEGIYCHKTKKEITVERTRCAIFGNFNENPYLTPEYRAGVLEMCRKNPSLAAAWIAGSYNHSGGGALDDKLILDGPNSHFIPAFQIPFNWQLDRSLDWASTAPFAVCWWAESNGEDVLLADGSYRSFPAGTLICLHEWYGTKQIGTNKGLKLSPRKLARGIHARENQMRRNGLITNVVKPGPADNQIWDVTREDIKTIGDTMAMEGIKWERSDKSNGSCVIGLQLVRDRLENAAENNGEPGLYFFNHCMAARETLIGLERDETIPDKVAKQGEDHIYDSVKYRVMASPWRGAPIEADWSHY